MDQLTQYLIMPHPWAIVAMAVACLAAICILCFYCPRVRRVRRACERDQQQAVDGQTPPYMPPASVIIYAQDQAESLERLLPQILAQEYPTSFEVIVINEGQSEPTRQVVEQLQTQYPNLYLTFTPDGARNLSRKKLALTLGVKAARHEVVVLTEANASVESTRWLQLMMRPMLDPGIEVVLGYAQFDIDDDTALGCRRRAFMYALSSVTWLAPALAGKPYRGISYNLAYRRDTFFRNKGFSRSLNLHYGDDDIFVNEIAHRHNTVVQLADEARVLIEAWNPRRLWTEMKVQHDFTARRVPCGSRLLMGFATAMFWLWLAATACAVALAWPAWQLTACCMALLLLALWIPVILIWKGTLLALGSRPLCLTLPWLILTNPLANLWFKILGRKRRSRNYTWN